MHNMQTHMCRLAEMRRVAARLQTLSYYQKLVALLIKFDGLMQSHIRHPNVAFKVYSQAMRHQEEVLSPA